MSYEETLKEYSRQEINMFAFLTGPGESRNLCSLNPMSEYNKREAYLKYNPKDWYQKFSYAATVSFLKCLKHINSGGFRMTPDFDALIDLNPASYIDIEFNKTITDILINRTEYADIISVTTTKQIYITNMTYSMFLPKYSGEQYCKDVLGFDNYRSFSG